jgi:DNA invertase Pin-like site-specific DNA recombinase
MRIAIYSRTSTDKQDNVNQLEALRQNAKKLGQETALEFVDVCTGGTSDREQFQRMFAAAKAGEFDLLLFWSLDRLSREGTETTLRHLRTLRESGVNYKSHEEQYLDTTNPLNDVFISFKAVMAVEEKKRISQRTKAGLAIARRRGVTLGRSPVPFDTRRAQELVANGLSVRAIAKLLLVSKSTVSKRLRRAA